MARSALGSSDGVIDQFPSTATMKPSASSLPANTVARIVQPAVPPPCVRRDARYVNNMRAGEGR